MGALATTDQVREEAVVEVVYKIQEEGEEEEEEEEMGRWWSYCQEVAVFPWVLFSQFGTCVMTTWDEEGRRFSSLNLRLRSNSELQKNAKSSSDCKKEKKMKKETHDPPAAHEISTWRYSSATACTAPSGLPIPPTPILLTLEKNDLPRAAAAASGCNSFVSPWRMT